MIETILALFCSLFILVLLYFVHKKLFSIIFTCLNMLSLFCDKVFMPKTTSKFKIFRSKSGCPSYYSARDQPFAKIMASNSDIAVVIFFVNSILNR